jgi:hypothetical protein
MAPLAISVRAELSFRLKPVIEWYCVKKVFGKCVFQLPIIWLDWLPPTVFFLYAWELGGLTVTFF